MNPISEYLFNNDVTNTEFAAAIGKTENYVFKLLRGDIFPSYNSIEQIDKIIPGFLPEFHAWYRGKKEGK